VHNEIIAPPYRFLLREAFADIIIVASHYFPLEQENREYYG